MRPAKKTALLWSGLVISTLVCIEGLSWVTLLVLDRWKDVRPPAEFQLSEQQMGFLDPALGGGYGNRCWHPDLGWTMTAGYGGHGKYVNSMGLCSEHEHSVEKPQGVIRIEAFGDSWVEAADVSTRDSWPSILERRIVGSEVLNFGVGGYGPDQAWLRYRLEGRKFKPDVVLICYMTENINRVVNVFRPFYGGERCEPFTKPRFVLESDTLRLIPNPIRRVEDLGRLQDPRFVRRLGRDDFWYSYRYGPDWVPPWVRGLGIGRLALLMAFQVKAQFYDEWAPLMPKISYDRGMKEYQLVPAILEGFYREVEGDGGQPLIVVFDPDDKIRHWRKRQILVEKVLLEDLDRFGLLYADYCTVLDTIGPQYAVDELFKGHPSELGNVLEAEMVIRRLLQLGWMDSSRVIDDPLVGVGPPQGVATPTVRAVESTRIA
jgi:hypothetical protein